MKKAAVAVFVVSVFVFGLSASVMASSEYSVWVKVPFSFYAGET